jgi:hypothetical protein
MAGTLMIAGEVWLPAQLMTSRTMEALEALLHVHGVLPLHAQSLRWRLDADTPGSYRLSYTFPLPVEPEDA